MPHHNGRTGDWTKARIAKLVELWQGGWSANECAQKLGGITRNAVIGKIHRLGMSNTQREERVNPRQRVVSNIKRKAKMQASVNSGNAVGDLRQANSVLKNAQKSFEQPSKPITVLDLRPGMCRYPQGERVPYTFCGAPKAEGSSYCETHRQLTMNHGTRAA